MPLNRDERQALAEEHDHLSHLLVTERAGNREFLRRNPNNPKVRPVEDRVGHGAARMAEIDSTFTQVDEDREQLPTEAELRALGSIITLEGADPAFPALRR